MGKNIVLIGLPGAGKTTLGKLLSEKTGFAFLDSDCYIEEQTGKTISELFEGGEDDFRTIETKAYKEIALLEDTIISTGGGVVKKAENIAALKQNGIIYYIDRSIEDITHDIQISSRPLLKDGLKRIYSLKAEREALYKAAADVVIRNDKAPDAIVSKIVEEIKGQNNL